MDKTLELFKNRLSSFLESKPHGAIGDFCTEVGISRTTLRGWLEKGAAPSLDLVAKAAKAMNLQPWELIKPEGAQSTPAPAEALASAALSDPVLRNVLTLWPKLDDVGKEALLVAAEDLIREQTRRKKPSQDGSRSQGTR